MLDSYFNLAIPTATLLVQQSAIVTRATACCWCILLTLHACHHLYEAGLCYQQGKMRSRAYKINQTINPLKSINQAGRQSVNQSLLLTDRQAAFISARIKLKLCSFWSCAKE